MKLEPGELLELTVALRARSELRFKQDVQLAARAFGRPVSSAWFPDCSIGPNGDDTATLSWGGEHVLFAAEGMRGDFIEADPWFAGFCAVMVNVNDIAAMGGRPWAVTDVLYLGSGDNARLLEGLRAASEVFGVPVVGGHTTSVAGPSLLTASVLGRARRLISSQGARPGQVLIVATDLRGSFRGKGGNFNAATTSPSGRLRRLLAALPELAEAELVAAGKDISMAGLCGSLLMLLETSKVGATLDLERVPAPDGVDALRWLTAFPSYGFVLGVFPEHAERVLQRFHEADAVAAVVGQVDDTRRLELRSGFATALYWDLRKEPLTGF